jgi:hypothetical protein
LSGFVAQTVSFLPSDVIVSSKTDPMLMAALGLSTGTVFGNNYSTTRQFVLGYVLSWATL